MFVYRSCVNHRIVRKTISDLVTVDKGCFPLLVRISSWTALSENAHKRRLIISPLDSSRMTRIHSRTNTVTPQLVSYETHTCHRMDVDVMYNYQMKLHIQDSIYTEQGVKSPSLKW